MQLPTDDTVDEKMVSLVTNSVSNSIKAQKLICMDKTLTQFRAIVQNIDVSEPSPPSSPKPPTPVPPPPPNPSPQTKVTMKKPTLPPSRNSVGGRGRSGGRKAGRETSVSSQKRTTSKTKKGIVAIDSDHEDSDVVIISTNESVSPPDEEPPIVASEVTSRSFVEKRSIGSSCAVVLTSPAKRSTIKSSTEEERSSGAKVSNESDINVLKTNTYLFNCLFALCDVMFKIYCIWYLF